VKVKALMLFHHQGMAVNAGIKKPTKTVLWILQEPL